LFAIAVYTYLYVRFGPGRIPDDQVRRTVRALLWSGALSATVACVDFYFQLPAPAGYGAQFVWLDAGVFRRAQGVFYEASTLGNLCAFLLAGIAVALVTDAAAAGFRRATLVLLSVPVIVALVLSYSRASILNLMVALLVLFWMNRGRLSSARLGIAAAVLGAAGAGILMQVFPSFFEAYLIRAFASLQYFAESPNAVLSGRLSTWMTLAQFIADNPLIVLSGTGYKTLPYSGIAGNAIIADNTWLSVLIETGVAGFLGLFCLNMAILTACYRSARGQNRVRSFLGTWFLCFWSGQMVQMLSADLLTYWRLLPAYFFVLALATSDSRQPSSR
jgi:O-antigen ligase